MRLSHQSIYAFAIIVLSQVGAIPLYNFYTAAGSFSEMQSEKNFILIEDPDNNKSGNDSLEELEIRIQNIGTSKKRFYGKITLAMTEQTAAEIITQSTDSSKENMRLTT